LEKIQFMKLVNFQLVVYKPNYLLKAPVHQNQNESSGGVQTAVHDPGEQNPQRKNNPELSAESS